MIESVLSKITGSMGRDLRCILCYRLRPQGTGATLGWRLSDVVFSSVVMGSNSVNANA